MIIAIAINAVLAAIVFSAVIILVLRGILPQRSAARAGAPVRIVTFNAASAGERRRLAEAA
jgi:hypothetical protein